MPEPSLLLLLLRLLILGGLHLPSLQLPFPLYLTLSLFHFPSFIVPCVSPCLAPLRSSLSHASASSLMYSSSNSFLGGANSARPGQQPPFMQQQQQPSYSQFPPGQQQQPQPTGFAPQPTGYAQPQLSSFGSQLQPQPTGFPSGQLQPQFTGFPGAAPQQSQQPQPTGFQPQQPQFTGYPPQSQPPQLQVPAATGLPLRPAQTSSEIANSFRDASGAAPPPPPKSSGSKIPNIRLSFITAQDQAKFEQLFKSAVGDSQTMSGM